MAAFAPSVRYNGGMNTSGLDLGIDFGDRPIMPTSFDNDRAIHQYTRLQILMDDWEDVIGEWLEDQIGAERAEVWGIPDTSANPLGDLARQLSTPGLYGKRPDWKHPVEANLGLVGPDGHLERAGWFTKAVFLQYLTLGLGDMFVRFDVSRRGKLIVRMVWPHDVFLVARADEPDVAAQLWELRRRYLTDEEKWVYTWDVYDAGELGTDGQVIREPSYRIHAAKQGIKTGAQQKEVFGGLGEDMSRRFLLGPDGQFGALVGEAYPFRLLDGTPVIPFAHYKDADTGVLWNHWSKRGAHRGTLNSALFWTYAGWCAKDATGSYVIIAGLEPGVHSVVSGGRGSSRDPVSGSVPVLTKTITPGAMEYHQIIDDATPFVHEVGPGEHLPHVADFADRYEMKQAVRWGLNPSDLSRQSANPSSAAALMVSNEGKREFADQVRPVFERADMQAVAIAAMILRQGGIARFAETGYSVSYHRIPRSPKETQEVREQLTWEEQRGQRSPIDTFRKLNPGTTEEDAITALVKVALDRARLQRAIDEALAAEGLEAVPPPQPPAVAAATAAAAPPADEPDEDDDEDATKGAPKAAPKGGEGDGEDGPPSRGRGARPGTNNPDGAGGNAGGE